MKPTAGSLMDPVEFMRSHREACSRGGKRSGESRRESSRRGLVEKVVARDRAAGRYDRDAASKIASLLHVSPRYVRKIAAEQKKAEQTLSSVPLAGVE